MMIVGFTGTQNGMTHNQRRAFFEDTPIKAIMDVCYKVHHGDCVGSDADFHRIVRFKEVVPIVIHPPDRDIKRAFCVGNEMKEPKPYLERNHDIVDACDVLIACPKSTLEEMRSGTLGHRPVRTQAEETHIHNPTQRGRSHRRS